MNVMVWRGKVFNGMSAIVLNGICYGTECRGIAWYSIEWYG